MKLPFPLHCCLVLILLLLGPAGAAGAERYGVAYGWDTSLQHVLTYRERLASLLGLAIDSQLALVGREQSYGVVWAIDAPLDRAKDIANQHSAKLRVAGLKPARPIGSTSFDRLYHLGYAQAASPGALAAEYARLKKGLNARAGATLAIEQTGPQQYTLVSRCWAPRAEALRIASQQMASLKSRTKPVLIAALLRPALQATEATTRTTVTTPPAAVQEGLEHGQARGPSPRPGATAGLNAKVADFLQEQTAKGRLRPNERAALLAYDLSSNAYLVSINASRPFQAASMIKPFVALAFFHQVAAGKATYTSQHRQMMVAMIQHSSNPATNWLLRQVGGPASCQGLLRTSYGHLFRQVSIREYIPPDGRTYQNSVLPSDYIQFLRALWNYQLPNAKELLRLMALPGPDRLLVGTELPDSTEIYNKTGTTALLCGDMGILVAKSRDGHKVPYALVGIVERPTKPADYKQWMHASGDVIRNFSSLVYEEMKRKHDLL